MILEALELAIDRVSISQSPTQWTTSVKQSAAEAIIEYLNSEDQGIG